MKNGWIVIPSTLALGAGIERLSAQAPDSMDVRMHSFTAVAKQNPIDPATGRTITTVESGKYSTVTVWQFAKGNPRRICTGSTTR